MENGHGEVVHLREVAAAVGRDRRLCIEMGEESAVSIHLIFAGFYSRSCQREAIGRRQLNLNQNEYTNDRYN